MPESGGVGAKCVKVVKGEKFPVIKKIIHRDITYSTEKAMAPHSSTLAWNITWTEEPGGPQSMGSLRVEHD